MYRFALILFAGLSITTTAQQYDLLIRGGWVIDPKNDVDGVFDIGITNGRVSAVEQSLPIEEADRVIDADGLIVTPGLIDIHGHVFWGTEKDAYLSNSYSALPPDGFTFRSGVTTVVDAGGAGWRNYGQFHEQTVSHSQTRVLAFLNIVGSGMKGGETEQDLADMDPARTASEALQFAGEIVGIKLAHFEGRDWEPVRRAVEAGRLADLPIMIDYGRAEPPMPVCELLMERLRPGDIYTHCYAEVGQREAIVDSSGALRSCALGAQERGVVFDVGHGGGSFAWSQARPATEKGVWPQTISTDLHTGSMNGAMKTMAEVMSKMLTLGMEIRDVVRASTWRPAQVIGRPDLGHLTVDAEADLAIFRIREGAFGFVDTKGVRVNGDKRFETELTLREGRVVWDLNGRAVEGSAR